MESLPEGSTAWALDRIKSDKRISGVIERLLERVLIVPNLSTALRLRPNHPGVTFVTLAGVSSNRPARNSRRHLNTMLAFTAFAMASFETDTPASHAAAARRRLNSTG